MILYVLLLDSSKYVVTGFYNNLKYLYSDSESIKSLLSQNNIKIQRTYLSHDKDVERIYELLKKIAICNANQYCLYYLFDDIYYVIKDTSGDNFYMTLLNNSYSERSKAGEKLKQLFSILKPEERVI